MPLCLCRVAALLAVPWLAFIGLLGGVFLLVVGAEALVRAGTALALRWGISPLWIGLTIVAFGTSMPEIVVSATASLQGNGHLAVANVAGSNILNILVVLGTTAIVAPMAVERATVRQDIPLVILAGGLVLLMLWTGGMARWEALLLLLAAPAYTIYLHRREKQVSDPGWDAPENQDGTRPVVWWVLLVAGLAILLLGGRLVIDNALTIAQWRGWSERIVGLTVVAIGTSLPELAVSLAAALRGRTDLAVGNLVGSNLLNLFAVLGVAGLVAPLTAAPQSLHIDLPMMVVVSALLWRFAATSLRVTRIEGGLLLAGYAVYLFWLLF